MDAPLFSQDRFNSFVLQNNIIGFFENPVTLKSGRSSSWYVNWRDVSEDVFLMDELLDFVLGFTLDLLNQGKLKREPRCFYGVPEGATKLGILTQYKWALESPDFGSGTHALAMGRGKPKDHGDPKDKYFVGQPRGETIILEDVTTTGGSLITTIKSLLAVEVPIVAAFGLTNRMEKRDDGKTVEDAIGEFMSLGTKIPYFHLSSALDLLPKACQTAKPSQSILSSIENEFKLHGVREIRLKA